MILNLQGKMGTFTMPFDQQAQLGRSQQLVSDEQLPPARKLAAQRPLPRHEQPDQWPLESELSSPLLKPLLLHLSHGSSAPAVCRSQQSKANMDKSIKLYQDADLELANGQKLCTKFVRLRFKGPNISKPFVGRKRLSGAVWLRTCYPHLSLYLPTLPCQNSQTV